MKTVNLVIFGIGNVGSTLINQINAIKSKLKEERQIDLKIPVITNSTLAFFADDSGESWQSDFENSSVPYAIKDIFNYVKANNCENLIAIDNTASSDFVTNYIDFVKNGFHIVAANKVANTLNYKFYNTLRTQLKKHNKHFFYETNVGAGLPVIETVRNLYQSGENVTKIRGVFSGSLSYIFNKFSEDEVPFADILNDAKIEGLTEPDPRDDLSGKDVARKLLILARELGLKEELNNVKVESLVPKKLNGKTTLKQFNHRINELNSAFKISKESQDPESVLRYIGELNTLEKSLEVKLVSEPKSSALGQLKGSDTLFEVYTESYNKQPLIIQGAGAGKAVTARGVLSDVLKIAMQI